ncbi:hypothetical protein Tco_1191949 [Tanacetum coccineum]
MLPQNSELNSSLEFTECKRLSGVKTRCLELEVELSNLRDDIRKDNYNDLLNRFSNLEETRSELDRPLDLRGRDFQISQLTEEVNSLQEQNELFRAENAKIKQHYKEFPLPILPGARFARCPFCPLPVPARSAHFATSTLDVEPIPPRNRNNMEVHLDYLRASLESVDTLRDIVKKPKLKDL